MNSQRWRRAIFRGESQRLTALGRRREGVHRLCGNLGAFGGRSDVMDYLSPEGPVYQAGTLSGNPLAMAAGLAQLRELESMAAYRWEPGDHRVTETGPSSS